MCHGFAPSTRAELVRDRQEELAEEERPERPAEERPDPQRFLRPDPVAARREGVRQQPVEHEVRDEHDLERDDQGHEEEREQRLPEAEPQGCEGERGHRARDQLAERVEGRELEGVHEEGAERQGVPHVRVVVPLGDDRQEGGRRREDLRTGLQRGRDHPEEGRHHQQSACDQQAEHDRPAGRPDAPVDHW